MSTELNQTPELTINDLQNLKQIVDLASRRGAFAASEMLAVGTVFSRLEAIIAQWETGVSQEAGN